DLLPHLQRDVLPDDARILTSGTNARENRVRIARIEREKVNDVRLGSFLVVLREQSIIAGGIDQGSPLFLVTGRKIETEPGIHIDETCDVFGTLDEATHPIQRI